MLNPIAYTESVIGDFLRYQLTTYPFSDPDLYAQMRALLNLEETRATPLMKGPYIKLSPSFRHGAHVADLVAEGVLHPHMANLVPFPAVYGHQETAMRAIHAGKTTLISTGTGSGKTEAFLYPIISHCLALRDQNAPAGIVAVIVYPMNALAEDQLGRLRELLAGIGISFGMYIGRTPETPAEVTGLRLPSGSSQADYVAAVAKAEKGKKSYAIHPHEERPSRQEMREPGRQPRILLTNVKQLELLLTRQRDVELFDGARLDYLVFDEAHTFGGAAGAETASLIRRLRSFCGKGADETVCVATSATIVDPSGAPDAGRDFAARFFGVKRENVALVTEEYDEQQVWAAQRQVPPPLPGIPALHLRSILGAIEDEKAGLLIGSSFEAITGQGLDSGHWEESLYDQLAANELVYQIVEALTEPCTMTELVAELEERVGRAVPEEEVLIWLALGAAARKDGRSFLRPVVHAFVRGLGGAVVTFPADQTRPKLWLSAEDIPRAPDGSRLYHLPITTCTTCGQHYFVHHLADFEFTGDAPGGGQAVEQSRVWPPLDPASGGRRAVLLDRLTTGDVSDDEAEDEAPASSVPVYLCRHCGAVHPQPQDRCEGCGVASDLVRLFAVQSSERTPGYLSSCVACRSRGGRRVGGYREPARPVRAVTVSDVHVLAQNMIHRAERRRLLVFADNRQDAAFQAGWMRDHARRFRLRSLMYEQIQKGPISIGDLTAYLDNILDQDDDLSRVLVPEVWQVHRKEAAGVEHATQRKYFLRIQVLRELVTGVRQRLGLEPWGRIVVQYKGLTEDLPFVQHWSGRLGLPAGELLDGVASLLDNTRRGGVLLDRDGQIFSRFWHEGDFEIQRGYMPILPQVPRALKLRREPDDRQNYVQQWLSPRGLTLARQAAQRWGVPRDKVEGFFEALWHTLTEEIELLAPVTITGRRNKPVSGFTGVHQIDADKLLIAPHTGVYRCQICRRVHNRPTPNLACMAWQCRGTIQPEPENPDDYDLMVLDQQFRMIRPREHSAQVPSGDREVLERMFKGDSELVNTLVCTPTLELGVDIGALDAVLMRNVPPLPSNYWQRVGRAGRRHRVAVNLTYARPASHDQAYYRDPLRLLQGVIYPPRFNLRNELMVEKHVHAAILTSLHQLMRPGSPSGAGDREEIEDTLQACFPPQITRYLFDRRGYLRPAPLDVTMLNTLIAKHEATLITHIQEVFAQGWPEEDKRVVTDDRLREYIGNTGLQLTEVIGRVWKRLGWALDQMARLEEVRKKKGTLDPDEDALWARCDRLVKKYKGQRRRRREAEGHDDINTYSVLAAEGFLPGYGLDTGAILGTAQVPRSIPWLKDFDLPRSTAIALREYVPGNLIYANGNRFVPRFYHLEPDEPTLFQVDVTNQAIVEVGAAQLGVGPGLGAADLYAVPMCDVDLPHQSHISDEEDYRFQMAVTTIGYEQDRHNGGKAYQWGEEDVFLRHGVHLRLVNVGAAGLVESGTLGYPVCLVCGQSRSPLASQADRDRFADDHLDRCGQPVRPVGFFADVIADALAIQDCTDRGEAYSLTEALRIGASHVLDMEVEDLQVLVIGQPGVETADVLLYDPMPGGSGLLEQIIARWDEVVDAALEVVQNCPSACETACIDCLYSFRNAFYHRYLNRHRAVEQLTVLGQALTFSHDIPANLPAAPDDEDGMPVNVAESRLHDMLRRAGFPEPQAQYPIDLGKPLGTTTPDFYYEDPNDVFEGVCLYLDGMSRHIHGNKATQQRDRQIREELRSRDYKVFEIPYGDLTDRQAMTRHFYRLGRILVGKDEATNVRDNPTWFEELHT